MFNISRLIFHKIHTFLRLVKDTWIYLIILKVMPGTRKKWWFLQRPYNHQRDALCIGVPGKTHNISSFLTRSCLIYILYIYMLIHPSYILTRTNRKLESWVYVVGNHAGNFSRDLDCVSSSYIQEKRDTRDTTKMS